MTVAAQQAGNWADLSAEAVRIVSEAGEAGVTLRVTGSAGIRLHCNAPGRLMDLLGRPAKDIDFVVPEKHRKGMRRYLESRGYITDRDLLIAMEGTRYSFTHAEDGTQVDVFVERLNFCHTIELRSRLSRHPITLPVEELMLAKLQIIEMTMTDIMDVAVILATHRVGGEPSPSDPETIDGKHIARLLSGDWGFHHTATRNLARITEMVGASAAVDIGRECNAQVHDGVRKLLAVIDAQPKSLAWRMRDKIGERKQWWQDVDDKEATY
jgi:hypothetical protein